MLKRREAWGSSTARGKKYLPLVPYKFECIRALNFRLGINSLNQYSLEISWCGSPARADSMLPRPPCLGVASRRRCRLGFGGGSDRAGDAAQGNRRPRASSSSSSSKVASGRCARKQKVYEGWQDDSAYWRCKNGMCCKSSRYRGDDIASKQVEISCLRRT